MKGFDFQRHIFNNKTFLWIIAILVIIIAYYNFYLALFGFLLLIILIQYYWRLIHAKKEEWHSYLSTLTEDFDQITRDSLFNLPIPFLMISNQGNIIWYNPGFQDICKRKELIGEHVSNILPGIQIEKIIESQDKAFVVELDKNKYNVMANIIQDEKDNKGNYTFMLYFIDITELSEIKEKYSLEKLDVCFIQVDNLDDIKVSYDEVRRPIILAEISSRINLFASRINAGIQKYQEGKYILFFEHRHLEKVESKRFSILDDIREISEEGTLPPTLSIGVGNGGNSPQENVEFAKAAMNIALGRGGDQAVVKRKEKLNFFGGKTKAVEKRNKVKARVISYALKQLIEQSEKVFIMGHKMPDMDAFGAAFGILSAVKYLGKEGYVVFDEVNPSIKNVYNKVKKNNEQYLKQLISPSQAIMQATNDSLVIVVDTHRPMSTEAPELLDIAEKVVVIDHHRRGENFIDNPILIYLEPYASSASELVTEILSYMGSNFSMEKIEAEALLAGINLDTKGFTFKTGVRTFEAASYLRRNGADALEVSLLFQEDLATVSKKAEIISRAMVYKKELVISYMEDESDNTVLIAAQAANELLNIRGIEGSFVMVKANNEIHISGRSNGKISVQLILEKLGGGGHMTVAGAQVKDKTIAEVRKILEEAIDDYYREGVQK